MRRHITRSGDQDFEKILTSRSRYTPITKGIGDRAHQRVRFWKFDGDARPNPGPAAIGYVVETDGWTEEQSEHIGKSTNNRTEYRAVIQGLELASEKGCTEVEARGDSQLVVKQVRDEWSVSEPELCPLRDRVQELAEEFESFAIRHVPRGANWGTDELVKVGFLD